MKTGKKIIFSPEVPTGSETFNKALKNT